MEKDKRKLFSIMGILLLCVIGITLISIAAIGSNVKSRFREAIERGDIAKAVDIYNEDMEGKEKYKKFMISEVKKNLSQLESQFIGGQMDYDEFLKYMDEYKHIQEDEVVALVDEKAEKINALNEAMINYDMAEECYENQDFSMAIAYYQLAALADEDYKDVQKKLNAAIKAYRGQTVDYANRLVSESQNYEGAVSEINNALAILENDTELENLLEEYKKKMLGPTVSKPMTQGNGKIFYLLDENRLERRKTLAVCSIDSMEYRDLYHINGNYSSVDFEMLLYSGGDLYAADSLSPIYQIKGIDGETVEPVVITRYDTVGNFAKKGNIIYYLAVKPGAEDRNSRQLRAYDVETMGDEVLLDEIGARDIAAITENYLILKANGVDYHNEYGRSNTDGSIGQMQVCYIIYHINTKKVLTDSFYVCALCASQDEEDVIYYANSGAVGRIDLKTGQDSEIFTKEDAMACFGLDSLDTDAQWLNYKDIARFDGKVCVSLCLRNKSDTESGSVFFIDDDIESSGFIYESSACENLYVEGNLLFLDMARNSNAAWVYQTQKGLWEFTQH